MSKVKAEAESLKRCVCYSITQTVIDLIEKGSDSLNRDQVLFLNDMGYTEDQIIKRLTYLSLECATHGVSVRDILVRDMINAGLCEQRISDMFGEMSKAPDSDNRSSYTYTFNEGVRRRVRKVEKKFGINCQEEPIVSERIFASEINEALDRKMKEFGIEYCDQKFNKTLKSTEDIKAYNEWRRNYVRENYTDN